MSFLRNKLIFIFICSTLGYVTAQSLPIYYGDCENGTCRFKNIHLTEDQPNFIPKVDIPNDEVMSIYLEQSHIPLLTSDMCDAFPNIVAYIAESNKISKVARNAFKNCRNLLVVDFYQNEIAQLDSELFVENQELVNLIMQDNKLTELDTEMFKFTPQLGHLTVGKNFLRKFNMDKMVVLEELISENLDENLFDDLDDEMMIQKFPKLRSVSLCPNDKIPRDRMMEIIANFENKGIDVYGC